MSYSYRVYGLAIDSTTNILGLHALPQNALSADLSLETGPAPAWVQRASALPGRVISRRSESEGAADPVFQLIEHGLAECFELVYSDGANFVVDAHARRVWGTFRSPLTVADLATYFLGPGAGIYITASARHFTPCQRCQLLGQAVALLGDGGFGKSTTAAALALRGVPVLSEDIAPMHEYAGISSLPRLPAGVLVARFCEHLLGSPEALAATDARLGEALSPSGRSPRQVSPRSLCHWD